MPHRKQVRHFNDPSHCHELTFSCYQRLPLLTSEVCQAMLGESIENAIGGQAYALVGFVFMPEHVHLLVYPLAGAGRIDQLLRAIKRPVSYRIKKYLQEVDGPLLQRLTIRQRPGISTFRFWQEGPGYDRNVTEVSTALASLAYVHANPVRRQLCQREINWPWSSAGHYQELPPLVPIPTIHGLPAEYLNG